MPTLVFLSQMQEALVDLFHTGTLIAQQKFLMFFSRKGILVLRIGGWLYRSCSDISKLLDCKYETKVSNLTGYDSLRRETVTIASVCF